MQRMGPSSGRVVGIVFHICKHVSDNICRFRRAWLEESFNNTCKISFKNNIIQISPKPLRIFTRRRMLKERRGSCQQPCRDCIMRASHLDKPPRGIDPSVCCEVGSSPIESVTSAFHALMLSRFRFACIHVKSLSVRPQCNKVGSEYSISVGLWL